MAVASAADGSVDLDLEAMASMMRNVQVQSHAEVQAQEAALGASAGEVAACAAAREAANTSALEAAAGICRATEQQLYTEEQGAYTVLSATQANLTAPDDDATERAECWAGLQAWLQHSADVLENKLEAWEEALDKVHWRVQHAAGSLRSGLLPMDRDPGLDV